MNKSIKKLLIDAEIKLKEPQPKSDKDGKCSKCHGWLACGYYCKHCKIIHEH